ncbi:hypothetical protein rosag_22880 [Roseisolibacter agri]|uniref:Reverse transcriptase domain-containing protein n=1 Tax=Roseisolibacter agri TaxID=2014610 RepID=A0AA37Q399_9BACT|nr:hypothetical protein rosag_22880 [Roseisolibacter agri]
MRAWQWILSNPDRAYKRYFGPLYRAYALAAPDFLADLRQRLLTNSYEPSHAIKLYFPKPSGLQRPFTLLTVEDQVVYQAYANVVAEKLDRKVRGRYNRLTFGHLYAGANSPWFYRDWRRSYKLYGNAMRRAFAGGYRYAASFDLTACYDTIDHTVLTHLLADIGLDAEFCDDLCFCLGRWTEAAGGRKPLYHGHGIPQGPLSSGMLAEVVLKYFDDAKRPHGVRYFRYVDDIRLFAADEAALRSELVKLDRRSKEVGLFPQSAKIRLHRVRNIEDEIKSISVPPESVVSSAPVVMRDVWQRLKELTARYQVADVSRFKFVLGFAEPNAALARRLLRVLEHQPDLFSSVFAHLMKYRRLSKRVSADCVALLEANALYCSFSAGLIRVLNGRVHSSSCDRVVRFAKARLNGALATSDHELRAEAANVYLASGRATDRQVRFHANWQRSWWVRANVIAHADQRTIGHSAFDAVVQQSIRDSVADVALVGVELLLTHKLAYQPPLKSIHPAAQLVLRRAGRIGRVSTTHCAITRAMTDVLGRGVTHVRWRRIFDAKSYRLMLPRVAVWRAYSTTDPTAWVSLTDTVNEIVLSALFGHDPSIGVYTIGKIGSVLGSPNSRFARKYPLMYQAAEAFHELRLQADLVHPVTKATQRPTRRIRYKEMKPLKRLLADGYSELWLKW